MILVNLTCGRNPWKQASLNDSTYRAYTRSQGFLKTILPVSDELNDILGRVFTRNPDQRITLPELRARILACSRFTEQPAAMLPTPPASPEPTAPVYVNYQDSAIDEDYDYDSPLSPSSPDSMSDGESTCSSDDGSLSPCSTIDDLEDDEDDFLEDIPEVKTPPPQATRDEPAIYEPEEPSIAGHRQGFMHPYGSANPESARPFHLPFQPGCVSKFNPEQLAWGRMEYVPPAPQLHHPVPFHYQVPMFTAHMQGCY